MHAQQSHQEKPRLTYAQFLAQQAPTSATVSALIGRYIREMNGLDGAPPVRTLGSSNEYILRRMMQEPVGAVPAVALTKHEFLLQPGVARAHRLGLMISASSGNTGKVLVWSGSRTCTSTTTGARRSRTG